jgi:hypothetical protein
MVFLTIGGGACQFEGEPPTQGIAERAAAVGQPFDVELSVLRGTGMVWRAKPQKDVQVRTLTTEPPIGDRHELPVPGSSRIQKDRVTCFRAGTRTVHWDLVLHAWEHPWKIVKSFDLVVRVK